MLTYNYMHSYMKLHNWFGRFRLLWIVMITKKTIKWNKCPSMRVIEREQYFIFPFHFECRNEFPLFCLICLVFPTFSALPLTLNLSDSLFLFNQRVYIEWAIVWVPEIYKITQMCFSFVHSFAVSRESIFRETRFIDVNQIENWTEGYWMMIGWRSSEIIVDLILEVLAKKFCWFFIAIMSARLWCVVVNAHCVYVYCC